MSFCVDYLAYTIKKQVTTYDEAIELLFETLPLNVAEDTDKNLVQFIISNRLGYTKSIQYPNGVQCFFDGPDRMGTHINLTGSVLNNTSSPNTLLNMKKWFYKLESYEYSFHISRVDIALDTEIDFLYFYNKMRNKEYISKSRNPLYYTDDDNRGTIYLGVRGNPIYWRLYDKNKCQKDKRLSYIVDGDWSRVEMECRNKACYQIMKCYVDGNISSVFKGHLMFVEKKVKNMSRDGKEDKIYMDALNNPTDKKILDFKRLDSETDEWFKSTVLPVYMAYQRVYGKRFLEYMLANTKISKNVLEKIEQNEKVLMKSNVYKLNNNRKEVG